MSLMKLSDVIDITTEANKGIFYTIYNKVKDEADYSSNLGWLNDYTSLDLDYYLGHSGEKYISPLYTKMIYKNKTISDLANIILMKFKPNWIRRFKALNIDYDPLANYDMKEKETVNSKITVSNTNLGDYKGFNVPASESDDYSPVNKNTQESTSQGDAKDNIRELERAGNVGVTTSAQLLDGELKIRTYDFIESVMKDVDSVLCLMTY